MEVRQQTGANKGQCQVCGDAAHYTYFGTLACQACKMFFKRYGNNQDVSEIDQSFFLIDLFIQSTSFREHKSVY